MIIMIIANDADKLRQKSKMYDDCAQTLCDYKSFKSFHTQRAKTHTSKHASMHTRIDTLTHVEHNSPLAIA